MADSRNWMIETTCGDCSLSSLLRSAIDQMRHDGLHNGERVAMPPSPVRGRSLVVAENEALVEEIADREPTPDLAAQLIEQYERLLHRLRTPTLRSIAVWKLEGFKNGEIAAKLNCSRSTVIRKLEIIRLIWSTKQKQ